MRIKVGVGEKPKGWDLADHVLGHLMLRIVEGEGYLDAVTATEMILQGESSGDE